MSEDSPDERRMSYSQPFPLPDRISAPSPSKIDEGFSESTNDAAEEAKPVVFDRQAIAEAWQWLLSLDDPLRSEFAHNLLLSLPNAAISRIVRDANRRLHFDPVQKLPPEILSHILQYLEPTALLNACYVSSAWKDRAYEPRLWRRMFLLEGWNFERDNVSYFERQSQYQIRQIKDLHIYGRPVPPDRHESKRFRGEMNHRVRVENGSLQLPWGWRVHDVPRETKHSDENRMKGIKMESNQEDAEMTDASLKEAKDIEKNNAAWRPKISEGVSCPLLIPSQFLSKDAEDARFNWQYLYNQRRRLEQNWAAGRFTNFRLPHPDHPQEAHTQCIYTIQFSANYLVSGSRDKTIRVWDMNTCRLKYPPLFGHSGSVLCLQFDEKEGIIISGGSDSHVIIWELETGKVLKRMENAHSESVLNLRFDDRYLVTCSKDKTIKLWNRRPGLWPDDPEYPGTNQSRDATYPSYIVNAEDYNREQDVYVEPLPAYSLLMQFEGHHAAVNAIQIYKDQIVSASGDRKIMLWDIRRGTLIRTFTGHNKGIACVQYDGRRIVSGSSDNTVRIFDSSTAAEVAVLEGHRNLVRTVQAEFGDIPGDEEAQEAEARENDRNILTERRERQMYPHRASWPQRYFVYGAKLPPGGGANRWSKIISGSYDETVMIWRMDKDGRWNVTKELRQEDAMRTTASSAILNAHQYLARYRRRDRPAPARPETSSSQSPPTNPPSTAATAQHAHSNASNVPAQHTQQNAQQFAPNLNSSAQPSWPAAPASSNTSQPVQQTPSPQTQNISPQGQTPAQPHIPAHHHPQHPHYQYQVQPSAPTAAANAPSTTAQPQNTGPAHGHNRDTDAPGISRVFKLQFDARRIICCSQQPVIVGWDFANEDKDIIEASQFFGDPL